MKCVYRRRAGKNAQPQNTLITHGHCSDCLLKNTFYLEIILNSMENFMNSTKNTGVFLSLIHPLSTFCLVLYYVLFLFVRERTHTHTHYYSLTHLRESCTRHRPSASGECLPRTRTLSYVTKIQSRTSDCL